MFEILKKTSKSQARVSRFKTRKGTVDLPLFCPVATLGSIKSLDFLDLKNLEIQMILANAYHLHIRPTEKLIQKQGGLHSFMNWNQPILTDSGGYQVFSLSSMSSITDKGVSFRNHVDGDLVFIDPETSVQIQLDLGSDILMAFDHCPLGQSSRKEIEESVERTHGWLIRSHHHFLKQMDKNTQDPPYLFGIVQGGIYEDLRKISLDQVESLNLPGIAVGGMSVGEDKEEMRHIMKWIGNLLPENKPRYLMGMGTPSDLVYAVDCGFDLFDCVLPTRLARSGIIWTSQGSLQIRNSCYKEDSNPLDLHCSCFVCQNYSRSYIRHLFLNRELLSYRLNTFHNIHFYIQLMKQIRRAIQEDRWCEFRDEKLQMEFISN